MASGPPFVNLSSKRKIFKVRIDSYSDKDIAISFAPQEIVILHHLTSSLLVLLESHQSSNRNIKTTDDFFEAQFSFGGSERIPSDAALARLLPDAYEDSDEASEFRKLTENSLVDSKISDIVNMQQDLREAEAGSRNPVAFDSDAIISITRLSLPYWVRTLTALRLTLNEKPSKEKNTDQEIKNWLGSVLEAILHFEPYLKG